NPGAGATAPLASLERALDCASTAALESTELEIVLLCPIWGQQCEYVKTPLSDSIVIHKRTNSVAPRTLRPELPGVFTIKTLNFDVAASGVGGPGLHAASRVDTRNDRSLGLQGPDGPNSI